MAELSHKDTYDTRKYHLSYQQGILRTSSKFYLKQQKLLELIELKHKLRII